MEFTLRIRVNDGANSPAETDVVVAVVNVNDQQPVFQRGNYSFEWNHVCFGVRGVSKRMGSNPVHGPSVAVTSPFTHSSRRLVSIGRLSVLGGVLGGTRVRFARTCIRVSLSVE
ncbi:hypothetical protein E2C01_031971 [Portunus trituberculatus]|uniref:Cadherin domain-containing protein n=1 Tax=Portunus trituberculatus TaxID=210409 RepID=A0A5B7F1J1_PORTR|nr:hypothetical protein [Portunus trituberculatus]